MSRAWWAGCAGVVLLGFALGCSSNPYRPTLFHRNRNKVPGPELGAPINEGPYLGDGGMPGTQPGLNLPPGAYVVPPGQVPPGAIAPGPGTVPPPSTSAPIPSFPQQGPAPVPQGPPPRLQPNQGTSRGN